MKVKAAVVQVRKRDGGRTRKPPQPSVKSRTRGKMPPRTRVPAEDSQQKMRNTRVGQKNSSSYTIGGKAENKSKQLLYVGLASIGAFLLLILIVVAMSSNDRGKAVKQPKRASVPTRTKTKRSPKGQYGAKYATHDSRMVMTEESQMAKDRKKRLSSGNR